MYKYILVFIVICLNIYYPRYLAIFILKIAGWSLFTKEDIELFRKYNRLTVVYPHTSYWDVPLMFLYRLGQPEMLSELVFLIRPDLLAIPIFGKFLSSIGGIAASCIRQKDGGRTKEIINYLNSKEKFLFAISPKGTIRNAPWKNGYYHIAKETNSFVTVMAYNYEKKIINVFEPQNIWDGLLPQDELKVWLTTRMKKIPQKNPQNLEY